MLKCAALGPETPDTNHDGLCHSYSPILGSAQQSEHAQEVSTLNIQPHTGSAIEPGWGLSLITLKIPLSPEATCETAMSRHSFQHRESCRSKASTGFAIKVKWSAYRLLTTSPSLCTICLSKKACNEQWLYTEKQTYLLSFEIYAQYSEDDMTASIFGLLMECRLEYLPSLPRMVLLPRNCKS